MDLGLWIGDNVSSDPLCVSAYQVEVCACDQPTNPTAAAASPSRVCRTTMAHTLVANGGSGEEIHWFSGACASSGPIAIALNGDPISIPSLRVQQPTLPVGIQEASVVIPVHACR